MLKLKVTNSNDKCMTGRELRRGLLASGVSERRLAKKMGIPRITIRRWMDRGRAEFKVHPIVMQNILKALGASSL